MINEINDAKPTSISHIVGQVGVVKQVAVALDAAFADGQSFSSALLVGPPGVGKSALAAVIACEMATDFHEVLGQSITSIGDLNALLLEARDKDVVHIDEAHELSRQFQTALYLALDKQSIFGGTRLVQPIPIADFTLLLSTTDEYCLLQPLRDRMKLTLRFEFYSEQELTLLLRHRCRALAWDIDEGVLPMIAQRSRGTPRIALRLLQACRRVCRAEGESAILPSHFERACQLDQIDDLGLESTEQKYLSILAEGPARLNVISMILGLPSRTVAQVTEQYMVRAGLIDKDKSGLRQLTAKGLEHVRSK